MVSMSPDLLGKTECIVFGSSRRLKKVNSFDVKCNLSVVKTVHDVKYLGVSFDDNITGKRQAETFIKCCTGRLSFL